jgi:cytochrome c-type biogenesis protein CcmE
MRLTTRHTLAVIIVSVAILGAIVAMWIQRVESKVEVCYTSSKPQTQAFGNFNTDPRLGELVEVESIPLRK